MSLIDRFIDRPIFATVLSAMIVLIGGITLLRLPVNEYPSVVPPSIEITARYPGASPTTIADTVAGPLEQQMAGVPGMLYQSSQSTADGGMSLGLTFALGTDLEDALVEVQNRISQAAPRLPEEVRRFGVVAKKRSIDLTMVVHLTSPDGTYDGLYLSNYANLHVKDALAALPGMGEVRVFGAGDYSMRVWLDPDRLAARGLNAGDVVRALREQNVQVAAGVLGAPPDASQEPFQLTVTAQGRLLDEGEFGQVIVRNAPDGRITRLADVARLDLDASVYGLRSLIDNKVAAGIPVFQAPGSNAVALSEAVRATMAKLKATFPPGIDYEIAYDPTVFIRSSIEAVIHTLGEAIVLVVIVVVLFLQTWRASIIPLCAVPVSLIGTFAVMHAFGFSINALSMFGLVLAIGIVVDDAIVVVENVERNIALGLSPRAATRQAMKEVSGPIIATALVLCAVFVPTAFISGLTGQFYKQFALTIAISTVISAINSLTLSPALSALLLRPHGAKKDWFSRGMDFALGWIFRPFNRFWGAASRGYVWSIGRVLRGTVIALVLYGGFVALTAWGFGKVPTGFIPGQDKQFLISFCRLPPGASIERTEAVMRRMSDVAHAQPGVKHTIAFPGLGFGFVMSSNVGLMFIGLDDFDKRTSHDLTGLAIAGQLTGKFLGMTDAFAAVVQPPPILGLGSGGGFKLQIEDTGGVGLRPLYDSAFAVMMAAGKAPELRQVFTTWTSDVPQIAVDIDRTKVKQYGLALSDVNDTLQTYLGSSYANDFNRFGRSYQVTVQADAAFRSDPADIGRLRVRNASGAMVPLSSVLTVREISGWDRVQHYNTYPSVDINGEAAPGYSADQARDAIERIVNGVLAKQPGLRFEWTETTYQQVLAGNTAVYIFPLCVLLVFLVLAAFYESWSLPLVVILIVPMCLLCALAGVWITGGDNNIFTQIGFIVLVGLACKNAILIVEFAKDAQARGVPLVQAALQACLLRLRPIVMTSLAFIMGVWPLVVSHGAGAENRHTLGVAVFSGMIGVTLFGLLLTPVFYVVIGKFAGKPRRAEAAPADQPTGH
jgi:hydrophobe/amphiphile efflux-1 (HAE1) family protein